MWLLGFLSSSSGIVIGGCVAWLFKGLQRRIDAIYALCAGLILGLLSIEILPEGIQLGGWWVNIIGMAIGIVTFTALHSKLHNPASKKSKSDTYVRTAVILLLSISIHNFPIGILLGASTTETEFGVPFLQTLFLHSIPEGIILFTPLLLAKINYSLWIIIPIIVSLPVIAGFYIGKMVGGNHQTLWVLVSSFSVGIIYMVTIKEILYESLKNSSAIYISFFALIGFSLMALYFSLIK